MLKTMTVRATIAALLAGLSISAHAVADTARAINVPAGDLVAALESLAKQAEIEIVYQAEQLRGIHTGGVSGTYEPREAVSLLLKGTQLTLRTDERPAQSREVSELEEIVVTGTHIKGSTAAGSRVFVIDREAIDASGYGRVQDLMVLIPQNFSGNSDISRQNNTSNLVYQSEVQLRGLGPGTTLTLVNGRRLPTGGTQGAFVDISGIPAAAIERIEVLPDGASALYGSDAIGGVVNFILRKDYQGAETRARYGVSSGGEAGEVQASQLFGMHGSAGQALFGYQYTQRDNMIRAARDYTATNGDLRPFGGSDSRTVGGNPGQILNASRLPAFAIPSGQNGTGLTTTDLLPSVTNYQDTSQSDLFPDQKVHSAFVNASRDFGDRVSAFADVRYSTRDVRFIGAGVNQTTVLVPSSNPFYVNPFGGTAPVRVAYDFGRDLGPTTQIGTTHTLAGGTGVDIRLHDDWELKISGTYGRESNLFRWLNLVNTAARDAALADDDPATALNVFGDGSYTNPATLELIRNNTSFQRGVSTLWSGDAIIDGSLMRLPAGTLRLAVGAEYRDETLQSSDLGVDNFNAAVRASRRDVAAFGELAVPLISQEAGSIPGIRELSLSLAGRYDEYSDAGSSWNPKVGLGWVVTPGFKVRGSWGTSFRAPPFNLSSNVIRRSSVSSATVQDPTLPTTPRAVTALIRSGTHTDLEPETANSWSAGFDFKPWSTLTVALSYFDIDYRNKIQGPAEVLGVLNVESRYVGTGVITRAPTQAQIAAICSEPGVTIIADCSAPYAVILDISQRNMAAAHLKGMDVEAQYRQTTSFGDWSYGLSGTHTFSYDQRVTDASPSFDVSNTMNNPPTLRARGTVGWTLRNWRADAAFNYTNSYEESSAANARGIDAWKTVDIGLSYRFAGGSGWFSDTRLALHATNLFNKLPPFVNQSTGYDPTNANILRRTVSVQAFKEW
jgi:iron complex outermembrane receptor protein